MEGRSSMDQLTRGRIPTRYPGYAERQFATPMERRPEILPQSTDYCESFILTAMFTRKLKNRKVCGVDSCEGNRTVEILKYTSLHFHVYHHRCPLQQVIDEKWSGWFSYVYHGIAYVLMPFLFLVMRRNPVRGMLFPMSINCRSFINIELTARKIHDFVDLNYHRVMRTRSSYFYSCQQNMGHSCFTRGNPPGRCSIGIADWCSPNQDFVWGFALMLSGLCCCALVLRYNPMR